MSSTFRKSLSLWALFWARRICTNSSLRVLNWLILFYSPNVQECAWDLSHPLLDLTASVGFVFSLKTLCDFPLPLVQLSFRKLCNHHSKNPNHCWKPCPALASLIWGFPVDLEASLLIFSWPHGRAVRKFCEHQLIENPLVLTPVARALPIPVFHRPLLS